MITISVINVIIIIMITIYVINVIIRLDNLAGRGVQLKSHYVQPTCTPSRCCYIMIDPQIIILTSQHDQPISAPWTNFSFNLFAEKYSAQFNHTHYHWIIIIIDLNIRAALMTGRYAANTGSRYPCLFIYFGIG